MFFGGINKVTKGTQRNLEHLLEKKMGFGILKAQSESTSCCDKIHETGFSVYQAIN